MGTGRIVQIKQLGGLHHRYVASELRRERLGEGARTMALSATITSRQPARLTAGPMNLEQMWRSLRSFLFIATSLIGALSLLISSKSPWGCQCQISAEIDRASSPAAPSK